jgi:hypothetical protein
VVLLSRVRHPSVPRLLDHGQWQPPRGEAHPCIVMESVEGLALYPRAGDGVGYLPALEVKLERGSVRAVCGGRQSVSGAGRRGAGGGLRH